MVRPMNDVLDNESWQCRTEDEELLCSRKMAPNRDGQIINRMQNTLDITDTGRVDMVGVDSKVEDRIDDGRMVIETSKITEVKESGNRIQIVVPR